MCATQAYKAQHSRIRTTAECTVKGGGPFIRHAHALFSNAHVRTLTTHTQTHARERTHARENLRTASTSYIFSFPTIRIHLNVHVHVLVW